MNLDELAKKHKTDKSSLYHNYAVKYDEIFNLQRKDFKKVLEIGIGGYTTNGGGESLRMWKEYFENATIYGLDIFDKKNHQEERIVILQGDQSDIRLLVDISNIGQFDLIVDDGSHQYEHQIISFENLFGCIKPGGFYILEDTCTSYWSDFGYKSKDSAVDYFKKIVDDVNFYGAKYPEDRAERRENLLDRLNLQKFPIQSITFMNSIIIIKKRTE